jgi:hypothetical protein
MRAFQAFAMSNAKVHEDERTLLAPQALRSFEWRFAPVVNFLRVPLCSSRLCGEAESELSGRARLS